MNSSSSIVCAMSGGVDSSVAALLLNREGKDVIGVSMQVWDYRQHGGCDSRATCCSPDDFTDARVVASRIGIPYYVFDFEKTFRREVIDRFVETYRSGRTPNPCIDCNSKVKFRELRDRAVAFGCSQVATGHYAQIEQRADGYHLLRGAHDDKDQSYFLYGMKREELAQTLFPVGHLTKADVRQLAEEAGLPTASKPESQDICFVSGTLSEFLVKIGGKKEAGPIITTSGEVIGRHDGVHEFTVGQRRGLGIGGTPEPLYVIDIRPDEDTVVVGSHHELEREGFSVNEVNWVAPESMLPPMDGTAPFRVEALVQVRSRHRGVRAEIIGTSPDSVRVRFLENWVTVSPGQAAVFYDLENREILGGGRITHDS